MNKGHLLFSCSYFKHFLNILAVPNKAVLCNNAVLQAIPSYSTFFVLISCSLPAKLSASVSTLKSFFLVYSHDYLFNLFLKFLAEIAHTYFILSTYLSFLNTFFSLAHYVSVSFILLLLTSLLKS